VKREEITLTLPRDPDFFGVAHLVVGGLAVRLNLTYEELEDLELALDNLLELDDGADDVTVAVQVEDGALRARVGPFHGGALRSELDEQSDTALGLRRILGAVADEVRVGEADGADWVELRKTIHPAPRGRR
jgi:serine/threonine-protein kinase RsbW